MPAVIGLDLSLTATGVAATSGHLHTIAPRTTGTPRLIEIGDAIDQLLRAAPIDLVVVEDLPVHGHGAGKTGMVHGLVRERLGRHAIPAVYIPPATLKTFATGRGNARKPDMRMELYKRLGLDVTDDNQVDALWLRLLGLQLLGQPAVELPATHLRAMAKVPTPDLAAA